MGTTHAGTKHGKANRPKPGDWQTARGVKWKKNSKRVTQAHKAAYRMRPNPNPPIGKGRMARKIKAKLDKKAKTSRSMLKKIAAWIENKRKGKG